MNFYIFVGYRQRVNKEMWMGQGECNACGLPTNHYLARVNTMITVCFVPIVSFSTGWYIMCEACEKGTKLKRKEYLNLLKIQREKLKNMQLPPAVVQREYNPKKVKSWFKLLQLIGAFVLGGTLLIGMVTAPAGLALMHFGFRNYKLAKEKERAFEALPELLPETTNV